MSKKANCHVGIEEAKRVDSFQEASAFLVPYSTLLSFAQSNGWHGKTTLQNYQTPS